MATQPVSDYEAAKLRPGNSRDTRPNALGYASVSDVARRIKWRDAVLEILAGSALILIGLMVLLGGVSMIVKLDLMEGILVFAIGLAILLGGILVIYAVTLYLRGVEQRAAQNRVAHVFHLAGKIIRKLTLGWMDGI